ncbi:MAG TPA: pepsin/retropepsin-like aspartic protease family protein [Kofleriaceae bacterium]|nr:pepsin/retropepsin-like aspartic protease family protein [Kofleriaceae bacterium]
MTCLLAGILAAACAGGGTPSGFSKGDSWSFPLVGPLEDGPLITPVSVRGHGPYLFLIDPDANVSVIDKQVVDEAGLTVGQGPTRVDETGAQQSRAYAELVDLKLGNLTVAHRQVMMVPADFYNTEGRRVNGVIGRDILADSLVFGFDRDQGIATLTTVKTFTPPPGAITIKYEPLAVESEAVATAGANAPSMSSSGDQDQASRISVATRGSEGPRLDVTPISRRIASAQIGGTRAAMHLDLGASVSQLRESLWSKAGLTPGNVKLRLVDEVATVREVTKAATADVTVGGAKGHVTLAPYEDKRFNAGKVDGALGLDFFLPYAVYAAWEATTFYLRPRGNAAATAVARMGRWGADMPTCPHPGCVTATLTQTEGGLRLDIVRDAEAAKKAFEVRIGVTPAAGKTAAPLVVELPVGADKITGGVPADYAGATLTVLDASPFTRPCEGKDGCVFAFASAAPTVSK